LPRPISSSSFKLSPAMLCSFWSTSQSIIDLFKTGSPLILYYDSKRTPGHRNFLKVPLNEPLPRRQGKCRNSLENEQMQEEIGLEMFESVPGSIVDDNTATPPPPVGFNNLNQIGNEIHSSLILNSRSPLDFLVQLDSPLLRPEPVSVVSKIKFLVHCSVLDTVSPWSLKLGMRLRRNLLQSQKYGLWS
jgi:hypothetical protein